MTHAAGVCLNVFPKVLTCIQDTGVAQKLCLDLSGHVSALVLIVAVHSCDCRGHYGIITTSNRLSLIISNIFNMKKRDVIKLNFNVLKKKTLILQCLKWYFSVLYYNSIVNCTLVYWISNTCHDNLAYLWKEYLFPSPL